MKFEDVLNIIALIIIPIIAVMIGQYLQDRAKKREDKMDIFKALMTSRAFGWTNASVYALIETIAKSLGYKNKITWETIQNPYIPKGMVDLMLQQQKQQNSQLEITETMKVMIQGIDYEKNNMERQDLNR